MKIKSILSNTIFFVQVLLLFLLLVESNVSVPFWVQPLGRMHPLILHFPVVLVILLFALIFLRKKIESKTFENIRIVLLYATAFTTSLTALMGFFLSMEEGYSGDLLTLHKWTGVALSFLVYGLLIANPSKLVYKSLSILSVVLVTVTGHFGANLTHGDNFLLDPIIQATKAPFSRDMPVFDIAINPILDAKCYSCHNPQKHKGDLDLTTWEAISKGGESGEIWIPGNASESDLIKRVMLPIKHDDHMPPDGKIQMNEEEKLLFEHWINNGADHEKHLSNYSESDTLYQLVAQRLTRLNKKDVQKTYEFKAASSDLIESLNSPFRTVRQSTTTSPALSVQIFVKEAYQEDFLKELTSISEQIVKLNLSYLPIKDEELKTVSQFKNLEKLILNYSDITTEGIAQLGELQNLTTLTLTGTRIDEDIADHLDNFKSLKNLHIWETDLTAEAIKQLQETFSDIDIDEGYVPANDLTLIITPPLLGNKKTIISKDETVELTHSISETSIFYTLDGSEPDSTSTKYTEPFHLDSPNPIKAIAYKEGWQPSNVAEFSFFIKGFTPKSAKLLKSANPKYSAGGDRVLLDNEKGSIISFRNQQWLGFQDNNFDALVDFGANPPKLDHVIVSYGQNMASYIMKPVKAQLYGGNSPSSLKLINSFDVPLPEEYEPNKESGLSISAKGSKYRYYRIVAHPYRVLPEWHAGSGDKGWVFVDELFFY